jgi:hypothetical protein
MDRRQTVWIALAMAVVLVMFAGACGDASISQEPRRAPGTTSVPDRLVLESPPPAAIAIANVTVIDVVTGAHQPGVTVVTNAGRIAAIGRTVTIPQGAVPLDGAGKFLVPGLWDMHAHHEAIGSGSLDLFVANGVVGTRDMGSALDFIIPLRARINGGELLGPDIVAAGPILDNAPPEWPFRRRVTAADDARVAVRDLKQRGVDFIKVHDRTPRDAFFAIAEEAPKLGLSVSGHVPSEVSVEEAAKAGLKSLEHLANFRVFSECSGGPPSPSGGSGEARPRYDAARCKARFDALAAHGVWQTPTLAFFQAMPDLFSGKSLPHAEYASDALIEMTEGNRKTSNIPEDGLAYLRSMTPHSLAAVRDLVAGGSAMLAGCDGLVPGFCIHDEMQLMAEAGLTPLQALQAATIGPARFLGREKDQGTVEVGKRADLVLLDADPLEDIRNVSRINAVIVRGRPLSRPDLDRILAAHRRVPSGP